MRLINHLDLVFVFACSALAVPITNGMVTCIAAAGMLALDLGIEAETTIPNAANFAISTKLRIETDIATRNMADIEAAAVSVVAQSNSLAQAISGQTMSDAKATMDACKPSGMLPIVRRSTESTCVADARTLVVDLESEVYQEEGALSEYATTTALDIKAYITGLNFAGIAKDAMSVRTILLEEDVERFAATIADAEQTAEDCS